jgi:hypothetical protein
VIPVCWARGRRIGGALHNGNLLPRTGIVLAANELALAQLGITGTTAFLVALFGYTTALVLTVAIFLKPFKPSKDGMRVGSEGLKSGVSAHPERMH